jgi:chromosome segregation ATPase
VSTNREIGKMTEQLAKCEATQEETKWELLQLLGSVPEMEKATQAVAAEKMARQERINKQIECMDQINAALAKYRAVKG